MKSIFDYISYNKYEYIILLLTYSLVLCPISTLEPEFVSNCTEGWQG